jgi:condensin-2 complex subunit D3
MVRRHAFVLLTQLLLQEYIKWRGMLLFRFLAVVVDRDEEIAELSKYVLRHTLQTKYSGFMVQNFSEAIIVFNNCSGHATYRAMAAIGADGGSCAVSMDGIDLSGSNKKTQRMMIYQFMMEDITEEEKIQITANLSQDILAYALDFPIETSIAGGGVLSPFESALEDAFAVLRSPLLRVGSKRGGNSSTVDDEDDAVDTETDIANAARSALHKAKTKVLKKLSVQHLVDHMLPVVSSLKHYLECKRSPVQKSLMEYLMYMVHSHKAEVALALSSDPGLKDEIEYDIKLYEREKNEESKRHKIHAAEKAVLNLEKSTTRKSFSKASVTHSKMSPSDDGFSDRMAGMGAGTGNSRRNSRATPQLHSSSKSKSSGRRGKRGGSMSYADDLSGRLGMEGGMSSPTRPSVAAYVPSARK